MLGLLIMLIVICFGGLLAFLGDLVGTKVGKKRLSIFGLRPKHTSMVITVLTGFFIAGLTLLTLTLMSDYVRIAIFKLEGIREQLKNTTLQVGRLNQQILNKEKEYHSLTVKHQSLWQNLQKVIQERLKVEEQLNFVKDQHGIAVSKLDETKENLAAAKNRLGSLTKVNEDLQSQIANLALQETRLNEQVRNLEASLRVLEDRNRKFLDKPMLFYVGEILKSKIIKTPLPKEEIFGKLIEPFLQKVDEIATKRGAKIPGKKVSVRADPQKIAEVCEKIANLQQQGVLRAVVEKNSVASEPVYLALEVYPNELIFKNNEVIASAFINGSTSEAELRNQLLSMVILGVNKAIEKGIVTENENFQDLISIKEMNQIIMKVKQHEKELFTANLVADGAIYRINPLKIKFNLKAAH